MRSRAWGIGAVLACLALGGFSLFVPLPRMVQLGVGGAAMIAAGVCFWRAWQASRRDPYDLKGLWDREDPPELFLHRHRLSSRG